MNIVRDMLREIETSNLLNSVNEGWENTVDSVLQDKKFRKGRDYKWKNGKLFIVSGNDVGTKIASVLQNDNDIYNDASYNATINIVVFSTPDKKSKKGIALQKMRDEFDKLTSKTPTPPDKIIKPKPKGALLNMVVSWVKYEDLDLTLDEFGAGKIDDKVVSKLVKDILKVKKSRRELKRILSELGETL